jgi:hypothetical protein
MFDVLRGPGGVFLTICGIAMLAKPAAAVVVSSQSTDGEISEAGTVLSTANTAARVGGSSGAPAGGRDGVLVFLLPTLSLGESVSAANLDFGLASKTGTPTFGVDLYGLAFGATSTPPGDYYEGALDTTNADLIQNDVVTSSTGNVALATDATGDANLVTYLNNQYAAGAGGQYVYLRFSPDADQGSNTVGYNVTMSEATTNAPKLTFTTVPEPVSAGLVALVGVAIAGARRRRRAV